MTDKYTILEICRCFMESGLRMIFCTLVINILSSPLSFQQLIRLVFIHEF